MLCSGVWWQLSPFEIFLIGYGVRYVAAIENVHTVSDSRLASRSETSLLIPNRNHIHCIFYPLSFKEIPVAHVATHSFIFFKCHSLLIGYFTLMLAFATGIFVLHQ